MFHPRTSWRGKSNTDIHVHRGPYRIFAAPTPTSDTHMRTHMLECDGQPLGHFNRQIHITPKQLFIYHNWSKQIGKRNNLVSLEIFCHIRFCSSEAANVAVGQLHAAERSLCPRGEVARVTPRNDDGLSD